MELREETAKYFNKKYNLNYSGTQVVTAKELLAVYDTDKRKDIPQLFQYYKMIFSCEILENHPFEKNIETSNCAYFSLDNLPPLSIKRTTKEQLMALMNQTTGALSD